MIPIKQQLIPTGTLRRSGQVIGGVRFIVSHDTGNDGSTAQQNVDYYIKSANDMEASSHFFVDDKQIICCVPENEKAWHVRYNVTTDNALYGKDANDYALGIELCFHSGNTLVNNLKAYQNYVDLHAYLCNKYNLNPIKDIVGHYTLDPARRTDPLNAFKYLGKTWEMFISDVVKAIPVPTEQPTVKEELCKIQQWIQKLIDRL